MVNLTNYVRLDCLNIKPKSNLYRHEMVKNALELICLIGDKV